MYPSDGIQCTPSPLIFTDNCGLYIAISEAMQAIGDIHPPCGDLTCYRRDPIAVNETRIFSLRGCRRCWLSLRTTSEQKRVSVILITLGGNWWHNGGTHTFKLEVQVQTPKCNVGYAPTMVSGKSETRVWYFPSVMYVRERWSLKSY